MTQDEQINCRFEPCSGSLNPHYKPPKQAENREDEIFSEQVFLDKLGTDFSKAHPEVFKRGILKKATLQYSRGEFEVALNTLMKGFKISSLRSHFEPGWEAKEAKKKKAKEAKLGAKTNKKKSALDELEGLNNMKEDPAEIQKKMPNEDFEEIRLIEIYEEAFALLKKILNRQEEADKRIA